MDIPSPGWLARELIPCGYELALCMLGAGLLFVKATDGPTATAFYINLATASDPLHELRLVYLEQAQTHPYLLRALMPLFGWAEHSTPHTEAWARRAAEIFANVDMERFCFDICGGDPLGRLCNEMQAIIDRRREPVEFCTPQIISDSHSLFHTPLKTEEVFVDTACASGMRALVFAGASRVNGVEPDQIVWRLADFDPVALALTAINFVCHDMTGDIELTVADFPVNIRELWPGLKFTRWITDVTESLARLTGEGRADARTRSVTCTMVSVHPLVKGMFAAAHGAIDDLSDEDIAQAREFILQPNLLAEIETVTTAAMGMEVVDFPGGTLVAEIETPVEISNVENIIANALHPPEVLAARSAMKGRQ